MQDPFLRGDLDPQALPHHLRRLHRKIMAAKRSERRPQPVDETGRAWPGLVTDPPPKEQNPT